MIMCILSFCFAEPKYQITTGLISVIGLILLLALSESFNNLSLGKIITLSKSVEKIEKEKDVVKSENKELRHELFKIVSNIQQSQVNNTFNAPSDEWLRLLGVIKSDQEEKHDEPEDLKTTIDQPVQEESRNPEQIYAQNRNRVQRLRVAENIAIDKYTKSLSVPDAYVIKGAEFSVAFNEIDPIMNRKIVFDGYIKDATQERFIEIRHGNGYTPVFYDRLYVMLNKIYLYRQAKGVSSELILIFLETDEEKNERSRNTEISFEPLQNSIANKLLRIEKISVSSSEIDDYMNTKQLSLL